MKRRNILWLSALIVLAWATECRAQFYAHEPDCDYVVYIGDVAFGFTQVDAGSGESYMYLGSYTVEQVPINAWQGWAIVAGVPILLLGSGLLLSGRNRRSSAGRC